MEVRQSNLCLVNPVFSISSIYPGRHCIAVALGRPADNRTVVAFLGGTFGERALQKHRNGCNIKKYNHSVCY